MQASSVLRAILFSPGVYSAGALILSASWIPGCRSGSEPATTVRIALESETVALQQTPSGPILNTAVKISNTSLHPIHWSACNLALERHQYVLALDNDRSEWVENWRPTCSSNGSGRSTLLRSGESVTVPITVSGKSPLSQKFLGEPGLYRVHFFLSAQIGGEYVQLPASLSVSQPFTLVSE